MFIVEIGFVDNESGLIQIVKNREASSVSLSVGIVERALCQVDDYDFMVEMCILCYL